MLYQEVELYKKLSQDYDEDTPISRIGGFLDGYEVGKEDVESHWIPCSAKLPKDDGMYYVTVKDRCGRIDAVPCIWYDKKWAIGGVEVIAWIKIPEPYRGEDK